MMNMPPDMEASALKFTTVPWSNVRAAVPKWPTGRLPPDAGTWIESWFALTVLVCRILS